MFLLFQRVNFYYFITIIQRNKLKILAQQKIREKIFVFYFYMLSLKDFGLKPKSSFLFKNLYREK